MATQFFTVRTEPHRRASIKRYVREYNETGILSLKTIEGVTESAKKSITGSYWEGYINHVKN